MSANWMWGVILVAAAAHALRVVPATAPMRQLRIPGAFAVLYVAYAVALSRAGFAGLLVSMLIVEVLLQLHRRRRSGPSAPGARRRP
jgi:hypothetical protein